MTDVSCSFSSDEFNDLGPRGQAYIFQERERLGLTHPPRSHNLNPGRGRGGGRHYHQERKVGAAGMADELSTITDSSNNNTGNDEAKDEHANTDSNNKLLGSRNGASFGAGAYKRESHQTKVVRVVARRIGRVNTTPKNNDTVEGHMSRNEMDTMADTSSAGSNWSVLEWTGHSCNVYPFNEQYEATKDVPIATCDTGGRRQRFHFGRA